MADIFALIGIALLQTKPAAIPIIIYNNVQTGANTQDGGLKKGFTNVGYQSFTELCVAKLDKKPTAKHTMVAKKIFPKRCICFCFKNSESLQQNLKICAKMVFLFFVYLASKENLRYVLEKSNTSKSKTFGYER